MKLSIAIPCYSMNGVGAQMLKRSLDILEKQTFKDFEVVVSDNSDDDVIKNLCSAYTLNINYVKNPDKGMAPNTNCAMKNSKGEFIKILYQDDFLKDENSLQKIVDQLTDKTIWLATGCNSLVDGKATNPHFPAYNHMIYSGNNTIGSPSVITIKNGLEMYFDENLTWLLDCDYYARLYNKFGEPQITYDVNVILGIHKDQVTSTLAEEIKRQEVKYMLKKII